MADMGVGETLLASEAIGSTAAAAEGGGAAASLGWAAAPSADWATGAAIGQGVGGAIPEGYSALAPSADWLSGAAIGQGTGTLGSGLMGPTYGELGYTGLGAGQMGPTYGELGYNGLNGAQAAGQADAGSRAAQLAAMNQQAKNPLSDPAFMQDPLGWMKANPIKTAAAGAGIYTLANILKGGALTKPNLLPAYTPVSAQSMGLGTRLSANYQPQRRFAMGGVTVAPGSVASGGVAPADLTNQVPSGIQSLANQYGVSQQDLQQGLSALQGLGIRKAADGGLMQTGPANVNFMGEDMYPQSQIHRSYYATPTQMPTSAQQVAASYEPNTNPLTGQLTANMASGGVTDLGSYSDGGRMLKGPGDGMSDNIPATIGGKQPARLADGEFVVPADVVSHLGNGSTDAGAKQLYSMMDKVRQARTGNKKQGKEINPKKYLKA
jgi:hypothetical protein